jgi:predicted Zn-dependent peptidase
VYGSRAYGQPLSGTPASLKALTRADLTATYARSWKPGQPRCCWSATSPRRGPGRWPSVIWQLARRVPRPPPRAPAEPAFPAPRVVVIDMPDAGQAGVVVARPGIRRADDRYYPLAVANTVLGGGFSSRLNQEIRIRGLAYGAGGSVATGRDIGLISARTQTKNPRRPRWWT